MKACSEAGCASPVRALGLCSIHYYRARRRAGLTPNTRRTTWIKAGGVSPSQPPTTRTVRPNGYVMLLWHTGTNEYVACYEHRHVMGHPYAEVHHKNHVRSDNRPENLEALTPTAHRKSHIRLDHRSIVRRYEAGESTEAIAESVGSYGGSISKVLKMNGVVTRTPGESNRHKVDVDEIVRLWRSGLGQTAIARAIGSSRDVVDSRLRERGLK